MNKFQSGSKVRWINWESREIAGQLNMLDDVEYRYTWETCQDVRGEVVNLGDNKAEYGVIVNWVVIDRDGIERTIKSVPMCAWELEIIE